MLLQQLVVDAGLFVEAVDKGLADHVDEVLVAGVIFAEEDQVVVLRVEPVHLVGAGAAGHIDLAADDGLDPFGLGGLIEVDDPVHHPVVGDGHRVLPQGEDLVHQLVDAAGPVEQAVLGVQVQVDKAVVIGHCFLPPLAIFLPAPEFLPAAG